MVARASERRRHVAAAELSLDGHLLGISNFPQRAGAGSLKASQAASRHLAEWL